MAAILGDTSYVCVRVEALAGLIDKTPILSPVTAHQPLLTYTREAVRRVRSVHYTFCLSYPEYMWPVPFLFLHSLPHSMLHPRWIVIAEKIRLHP